MIESISGFVLFMKQGKEEPSAAMSEANHKWDRMKGENSGDGREGAHLERKYQRIWSSTPVFTL